jgi:hypothetical protein
MIDVRLEIPSEFSLQTLPQELRWALQRFIAREAQWAARDMKQELARQRIAATSLLINSIKADPVDADTWQVAPHVEYARYVLEGRRPGGKMPPWRAIADWLKVKGLGSSRASAWAIARAIARRGIKGRDYLTPVAERTKDRLQTGGAAVVAQVLGGGHVG